MPGHLYNLPAAARLPLPGRQVHLPTVPEVLRDYGLGAPVAVGGGEEVLATDADAQSARDRIERLLAATWDEFRGMTVNYGELPRLFLFMNHAERVLDEAGRRKGDEIDDDDEAAFSCVRFRHEIAVLVVDRYVAVGDVPTWDGLPANEKDAVWRNVRVRYTRRQLEYLEAAEAVHGGWTSGALRFETKRELFEAIARKPPVSDESMREAVQAAFRRTPLDFWPAGGTGRSISEDDVRTFLGRVHDAWERYGALTRRD